MVSEHTHVELDIEFHDVKAWAATNCPKLNVSKANEMIFKRPMLQHVHMPPVLDDIEQLERCVVFGVIFQFKFKIDSHIHFIQSHGAQYMYLLNKVWPMLNYQQLLML